MNWPAKIVRRLLELRAAGEIDFNRAWARAVRELPVPERLSRDDGEPGSVPLAAFFRDACRREWLGLVRSDFAGLRDLDDADARARTRRAHGHGRRVDLLA